MQRLRLILLCTLLAMPIHHAVAQTAANQTPTITRSVTAVAVDVVVTGRDGQPISGLRKEDFQITEDRAPQSINFFEEHPASPKAPAAAAQLPPNTFSNTSSTSTDTAVTVLLLDSLNTLKEDQALAQQQVIAYLRSAPAETPVAIFALGEKLRMVHGFTRDSAVLLAALQTSGGGVTPQTTHASNSPQDDADDRQQIEFLKSMNDAPPGSIEAVQHAQVTRDTYQRDQRISASIAALQTVARFLADFPGRKNLVWLSGSFPIALFPNPGVNVAANPSRQQKQIQDTVDLLAASHVAIYPLNAQGVQPLAAGDATDHFVAKAAEVTADSSDRAANVAAMSTLASGTGGAVVPAGNDLNQSLIRTLNTASHYYTLSYTATDTNQDGRFRSIAVTSRRSDLSLTYRRGYYASPTASAAAPNDPLQTMMRRGAPSRADVQYEVHIAPATPQPAEGAALAGQNKALRGPTVRYQVEFNIRAAEQAPSGRVQVELVAHDRDGKPVNWTGGVMNVEEQSASAPANRSGVRARLQIDLPKEAATLATGVYLWNTAQAGTLEVPLSSIVSQAPSPSSAAASAPTGTKALITRTPETAAAERAEARRITLSVVIKDRAGNSVLNLTQRDIALLDNGRPRAIASFQAQQAQNTTPPAEVIIVLDTVNTPFTEVATLRQGIVKYLRENGGQLSLPTSIVYLTDGGVKLNQPSRDGNALAEDVTKLPTPIRVDNSAQGYDGLQQRFQRSILALTQLAGYEGTRPGRKVLLWLGPGWPNLQSASFYARPRDQRAYYITIVDLSTKLREGRITLYSIDSLDLTHGSQLRAQMYQEFLKGVVEQKEASSANLTAQVLAVQSGGLVLGPTGDVAGHLAQCVSDTGTYYEVAFDAQPAKTINEYHALQIAPNDRSLTARTSTAYYAQP